MHAEATHFRTWSLAMMLVASILPGVAQADDVSPDARAHFKAGVSYLEDPEGQRFEDAFGEFKKAYELSHSPQILGNLGLCAMKLERDGEAIDAYTRYLAEVTDIDPGERTQIARDVQTLSASVVTASIATSVPSGVLVDTRMPVRGSSVTNVYDVAAGSKKLRLRPGHHVMHLRVDGRDVSNWEFTAEAAEQLTHRFEAPSATVTTSRETSIAAPIVTIGLGAAVLAAGAALGASTLEKVHSLEGECPNNGCPPSVYSHDLASAHSFVTATDFTLLGGGALTASGIVWLILSTHHSAEPTPAPQVSGACTGAGCYATVHFGF